MSHKAENDAGWGELELGIDSPLRRPADAVARMTRPQREARLDALIVEAWNIYDRTTDEFITNDGRRMAASVLLFSGGNDSTTLAHLFRETVTHAAHADTTVGIDLTREFVRNTCKEWGLPLIERKPPRNQDHYRNVVLGVGYPKFAKNGNPIGGFPGPAQHAKMYQRLKERALEQVRNELVSNPLRERVAFIGGRRRDESQRRSAIPENGRRGSIVWVSPLVNWTKLDLNTYRLRHDVPRNRVSDLIHMSGECLCGAFSHPGELDEIEQWFAAEQGPRLIRWLERELRKPEYDHIPDYRKTWGWGAYPELRAQARRDELVAKSGGLCGCEDRYQLALFGEEVPA